MARVKYPMRGRVAVITGAGSGIGRALATPR
jgi:NAD(P)-dependent dehydrogenase (short-subunit alcohol dehydrogenase family)